MGHVSGPGVSDFGGCLVYLYDTSGTTILTPAGTPPVAADGSYTIAGVPPGRWRAQCVPATVIPLAAMAYHQAPGIAGIAGTALRVLPGLTLTADFALAPAGLLRVLVIDAAANPIPSVIVQPFAADVNVAVGPVRLTDATGAAYFGNVPLLSKVLVMSSSAAIFAASAATWADADVVTIASQGGSQTVTVTTTA
jgi:hypothetical protein